MNNEKVIPRVTLVGILPKPDPRSLVVYLLLLTAFPASYLCLYVTGMRLAEPDNLSIEAMAAFVVFLAWMLRRGGHGRLASAMETVTLLYTMGSVILLVQYPMIAWPIPYADGLLSGADHLIGFDWLSFARLFRAPVPFSVLKFAYHSMHWQAPLLLLALCAQRLELRAWRTLTATVIALNITLVIFPFFPADGAYALCGLRAPDIPVVHGFCDYRTTMHLIKDGGVRVIERSMFTGMVAFPSFHTAAAVLLVWGMWPFRWLRVPSIVLNSLLFIATVVVGGHYLVDLFGGAAVAAGSIWLAVRLVKDAPKPETITEVSAQSHGQPIGSSPQWWLRR